MAPHYETLGQALNGCELNIILVFFIHNIAPEPRGVARNAAYGHGNDRQYPRNRLIHIEKHGQIEPAGEEHLNEEMDNNNNSKDLADINISKNNNDKFNENNRHDYSSNDNGNNGYHSGDNVDNLKINFQN